MQLSVFAKLAIAASAATLTLAAPLSVSYGDDMLVDDFDASNARAYCSSRDWHCVYPGNGGNECTNAYRDITDRSGRFLLYVSDVDAECYGNRGGVISINFRSDSTRIQVSEVGTITAALSNRRNDVIEALYQNSYSGEGGTDVYVYDRYPNRNDIQQQK